MDSRNRATVAAAAVGLGLVICGGGAGTLEPGDQAPPLQVTRWFQGDPVNLAEGEGRTIYVVQFWTTSSPQCLRVTSRYTALQQKFKGRGVVCCVVTGEPVETVERFLKEQGREIGYRMAVDDGDKTQRAYLGAAGVPGLPHAFIVDRAGLIAWRGHPLDDLESVLERVVSRDYQPKAEAPRTGPGQRLEPPAETSELEERFGRAYEVEDWDQALGYLDQLIELNPDDRRYLMVKLHLLITRLGDLRRANEWGLGLVKTHRDDADFLNELSWRLLTTAEYGDRCMELAYRAALAAQEASGGTRYDITDTLARALYQLGLLDQAIPLQEKAVRLAQEQEVEEAVVEEITRTLRYYRDCAAVREQATTAGR